MTYWISILKECKSRNLSPEAIFNFRVGNKIWSIPENLKKSRIPDFGEEVIVYAAGLKKFLGSFVVASSIQTPRPWEKRIFIHECPDYEFKYIIRIKDVKRFDPPLPIEEVLPHLNFIKNKKAWGIYFKGIFREIWQMDFEYIIKAAKAFGSIKIV